MCISLQKEIEEGIERREKGLGREEQRTLSRRLLQGDVPETHFPPVCAYTNMVSFLSTFPQKLSYHGEWAVGQVLATANETKLAEKK